MDINWKSADTDVTNITLGAARTVQRESIAPYWGYKAIRRALNSITPYQIHPNIIASGCLLINKLPDESKLKDLPV